MLDIFTWNLDLAASSCSDRRVPSMDHMRQSQDRSQWQSPFQQRPLGQEDSTCWHCLISWFRNEKVSHAEAESEGLLWMKYEIPYPQERQNHGAPPPSHPALTTARFPVWRVLVSRSCGLKLASKNTAYLYVSVLVSTIVCSVYHPVSVRFTIPMAWSHPTPTHPTRPIPVDSLTRNAEPCAMAIHGVVWSGTFVRGAQEARRTAAESESRRAPWSRNGVAQIFEDTQQKWLVICLIR